MLAVDISDSAWTQTLNRLRHSNIPEVTGGTGWLVGWILLKVLLPSDSDVSLKMTN
jgi:hypothetical protein